MEKQEQTFLELCLRIINNCLLHLKLCIFIVVVPTILTFIAVMWIIEPRYEIETIVTPPSGKSSIGGMLGKFLENSSGLSSISSMFNSQDKGTDIVWTFLNSWELHEKIIEKFNLVKHYEFDKQKKYYRADVLKAFRKNLTLDYNDENMFVIKVEDEDYKLAVDIIEFILFHADSMYNDYKTTQARQARSYMDARLLEVKTVIDSLEKAFTKFQSENNFYDPTIQLESTVKYLGTLQAERDAIAQEVAFEKMNRGENTKRYEELSKRLQSIDASILQATQGKRNNVGMISLKKSPDLSAEYLRFESELKIQTTIYKFLRQQSEQLKLEEVNQQTNLVVLEPPWENDKKVYPRKSLMLAFTGLISGISAIVVCCFLEFWKRVRQNENIKKELDKVFALLPFKR